MGMDHGGTISVDTLSIPVSTLSKHVVMMKAERIDSSGLMLTNRKQQQTIRERFTMAPLSQKEQRRAGLHYPVCPRIRQGEKTATGQMGDDIMSSMAIQKPMSKESAEKVWALIPDANKTAPTDAEEANGIAHIAYFAEQRVPEAVETTMTIDHGGVEYVTTPGGPFIRGIKPSKKFPKFLYANMDAGYRCKWYNMTGSEQWEWIEVWTENDQPDNRLAGDEVHGLRGTNLGRIMTEDGLKEAIDRSPSLLQRARPENHALTEVQWETARQLFMNEYMDTDNQSQEPATPAASARAG
jgi:hypothetical protein